MAQQYSKRRSADKARSTFMLLMLSVVLVFAFGLIIGKQANDIHQAESVQRSVSNVPKETTAPTESETSALKETIPEEEDPDFHQASSFWSEDAHIYLRVSHEKPLRLAAEPDFDLSDMIYGVSDENIAAVDENGVIVGLQKGECVVSVFCNQETLRIPVTVRELVVRDGCTYVDDILVANKTYSLPEDYDPGMHPETKEAFEALQADAKELGLDIYEGSGYRNYQYQISVYRSVCDAYGEEYANQVSARPGYSEHQTGYTIDCNSINDSFSNTPEGQWLAQHCHEYGFIIRYPAGKEDITGYAYESWHIRYVGVEAATEMYEQNLTLEEYLDIVSEYHPEEEETEAETELIEEEETEAFPEETEFTEPEYQDYDQDYDQGYDQYDNYEIDPPQEITDAEIPDQEEIYSEPEEEFMDAPLIAP